MTTRLIMGNRVTTVGGANGCIIQLPPGSNLRFASARNFTTPGQRVQIVLADASKNPGTGNVPYDLSTESLPIAGHVQDGVNDQALWSGESGPVDTSLGALVAIFWNCQVGDILLFSAGVDL